MSFVLLKTYQGVKGSRLVETIIRMINLSLSAIDHQVCSSFSSSPSPSLPLPLFPLFPSFRCQTLSPPSSLIPKRFYNIASRTYVTANWLEKIVTGHQSFTLFSQAASSFQASYSFSFPFSYSSPNHTSPPKKVNFIIPSLKALVTASKRSYSFGTTCS